MKLSNTAIQDKDFTKSVKIRFDLKRILQEYGLNINDLHEALKSIGAGISKQTLYGYQRDADSRRPSLGNLEYIAAALSEQAAMSFNVHDMLQFETTSSRTKGLKAQRDGAFDDAITLYTQALQQEVKVINLLREARTYYRTASYGFNYINDLKGKGRNKRRDKKVIDMLKTLQS